MPGYGRSRPPPSSVPRCTGSGLTLGHAELTTGTLWEVSGTSLARVSPTDLSATASSITLVDEADVGNIAVLDCPGLSL